VIFPNTVSNDIDTSVEMFNLCTIGLYCYFYFYHYYYYYYYYCVSSV